MGAMFQIYNCLVTEHDLRLVVIAGLVCLTASFAVINLYARAQVTSRHTRVLWLGGAAISTGSGIWATHFVAMRRAREQIGTVQHKADTLEKQRALYKPLSFLHRSYR